MARNLNGESDRIPSNFPNSDRTPSTSQHPFLTNHRDTEDTEKERSHPLNSQTAIAPLNSQTAIALFNLPNSDRTPSTSPNSDRTPPTSQTAIAPPQLQTAIAPLQLPKQRSHPLNSPNSDRTPSTLQTAHPSNFPKAITLPHSPNSDRTP
ncbi:hypothetical protein [Dolichospermum heterosporum]|uniref:Uncharacterized protein n=1 Tax=Dolichospermum heterosporum TAC447 TaxID=747523 RepID=A0ABY5M056_9CYAN|nr:hypothetical protein [Dolichospermum heterosporum]UUO15209.1 hypothetical protein NG743_24950 [Dolichospermum heterosporum TAC447]